LFLTTAAVWIQHVVWERRVDHELFASAGRLPELLRAQSERTDLLVQAGLRAEGVLGALGDASNMDAALGLAEDESREDQLAKAHKTLLSADLPGMRTGTRCWSPIPGAGWCSTSPPPTRSARRLRTSRC
jgi:hypothetical protein